MTRDTLLSLEVGVPATLVAMALLLWVEANSVTHRRNPVLLKASAAAATVVVFFLVIARFVEYS